jgi:hypothetical protein
MSFSKDKQSSLEWSKWKKLHEQKLLNIGLPESIFKSESQWWYFLEHGYDLESEWEPNALSRKDAEALLRFLENEYKSGEAWSCISDIRDAVNQ